MVLNGMRVWLQAKVYYVEKFCVYEAYICLTETMVVDCSVFWVL